ncbi:hypothetical protein [Rhizobium oryzicola]|uniref:Uncharacterized protein n=1 Tax=Rhizobium oryzicola TaxID=1232668 RepID=A0ABT8STT9_9HYPH|nr:hypothetical protein [Rhizobium oryzicola]MDO1581318.1 hypothetical protein [Rhizobium oryzicola]
MRSPTYPFSLMRYSALLRVCVVAACLVGLWQAIEWAASLP